MKKTKGILTVLAVFAMSVVMQIGVYAADTVSIGNVTGADGIITVKGTAAPGEIVTFKMTAQGADARDFSSVFAVKEATADEKGNFKFEFAVPDTRNDVSTAGNYVLTVASGGEKAEKEFSYASKEERDAAMAKINGATTATSLATVLKTEDPETLKNIGMDSEFDKNGDAAIEELARLLCENENMASMSQSGLAAATAQYAQMVSVNIGTATEVEKAIAELNPSCGDDSYSDTEAEEQKFIADYIYANRKYDDSSELEAAAKEAAVLYDINEAKYTELLDIIVNNADTLGISSDSAYTSYKSLSATDVLEVGKLMVKEMKTSTVKSISGLLSCISDNVTKYNNEKNKETSKGNGGGGGGGGRTGNSYSLPVVTPVIKPAVTPEKTPDEMPEFTDVEQSHWAKEYIGKLAQQKIIAGYTDGSFKPSATVKREEFVKLIVAAKGIYDENAVCGFEDVNGSAWYASYIGSAVKGGLVNGISENAFGVGSPITREAAAVIIARAIGATGGDISAVADGDSISGFAKDSVAALSSMGIIGGNANGEFMPKNYITRAETAKMIYLAFGGNK